MKKLIKSVLLMSIMSFGLSVGSVYAADSDLSGAGIVTGGFGTFGHNGEPGPYANAAEDAKALYEVLNVQPSGQLMKKIVGVKMINETELFGLECREPKQGISRLEASCSFDFYNMTAADQLEISTGEVDFEGVLAEKIFVALDNSTIVRPYRIGAVEKQVGNLRCFAQIAYPLEYRCVVKNMNYMFKPLTELELKDLGTSIDEIKKVYGY